MRTSDTLTPPLALQQKDVLSAPSSDGAADVTSSAPAEHHWTRICTVDDIPRLGSRVVRRGTPPNVAVFRTANDKLYALADRCPHRGGPLSQGIVFGDRVACPLHNTCVELPTGCAVAPDKGQVRSFAIKVSEGNVYVDLRCDARAPT